MTVDDNKIKRCKKLIKYSNVKRGKVAAIAFTNRGYTISSAHNRSVPGSKIKWSDHAEALLIKKLKKVKAFHRYNNITILVIRINNFGISMAKPCHQCQKILDRYNIKVMYSDRSGQIREKT